MDSKRNIRVGIGTARKALMKVKQNALMKVNRYAMLEALMKGQRDAMMMKPLMKGKNAEVLGRRMQKLWGR